MRELLAVPGYPALFTSSFLWHVTRWGSLFTTSYLLTHDGASPFLNQVLGALLITPVLLGGFVAGLVSDRIDRRTMVISVQLLLIPVQFGMFVLAGLGVIETWMTFIFMLVLGLGALTNLTAQRVLIYETVGPRLVMRAMPIETTAFASSAMFGGLVGGVLIDRVGVAGAYFALGALLCVSVLLLQRVPQPPRVAPGDRTAVSFRAQMSTSAGLTRRSRRLVGTLAVTVVMNLFLLGYLPLVPVLAEQFSSSALTAGVLGAAAGCGQVVSGLILTIVPAQRHGRIFAAGSAVGLVGLLILAIAPAYPVAWIGLFVLGFGLAGFGSTMALLAMESAEESERGAALGLVGTAIGVQPIGMLCIGAMAAWTSPVTALLVSSLLGLAVLGLVLWRVPELTRGSSAVRRLGDQAPAIP